MSNPFWSDVVSVLEPYVPGEQPVIENLVKLNTNENPYGPSPKAVAAMQSAIGDDMRLYPAPNAEKLKNAIGEFYGVDPACVFVGNGSDEVLAHIFHGLLKHDKPILFPDITYSFYPTYCKLYGIDFDAIPLNDELAIDLADYQRSNGGIIFPNPNAPTGRLLALEAVEQLLLSNTRSVVVVDEAYIDFGGQSAAALINKYPNLVVVQTLSKSRSLAGLRVGLAIANPELVEALERIKNSFNCYPLSRVAIAGAVAAFDDREYFEQTCQQVIDSRDKLAANLEALNFDVLPSAANFVFACHREKAGAELLSALRERGVVVRHFAKPRIDRYLRITVGTDQQNQRFIDALNEILASD
ncbi:histidinol-phosphate transaminase [Porticoccaceae bacterium LTM1]|nr:histidinol-phosphate transaminase [Porticoccaceae bacterium LTM1]